ncbi:MAG: cyclic nucleotide-binding domain-containing protein [Acidobacteriota bacterium]|nr:cyclic nucleotide-binding domain-containing protein [Acidobacteriota bacterium]
MAIKGWFRGGGGAKNQQEYSVDDLIVLERYEEAAEMLRGKLKANPQDLHAHLKLAEVWSELKQYEKAVDEYAFVADEYAQDGFYDKGIALLSKAARLAPLDTSLRGRIEKLQREKSMEHVRALAIEGLRQAGGEQAGSSALELQRLWHNLAGTRLVERLPAEQLKRLFSSMELVRLGEHDVVAKEGAADAYLLLIVRGVIDASIAADGQGEVLVRSFGSGDIVGEGALLEHTAWPASYRVSEAATVLKLGREGLEKAMTGCSDPRGFLELLRGQHNDKDVAATARTLRSGS